MAEKETTHRFFAPSAAPRWMSCTASAVVNRDGVKETKRASADRGTQLHIESEKCLREGGSADSSLSPPDQKSVNAYVEFVRARKGFKLYEFKSDLLPGLCGGTSDCVIIEPEPHVLEIIDYKSGSMFVDPVENFQLAIYWLGTYEKLKHLADIRKVKLTIAQPALDNYNSWEASVRDLDRMKEEVESAINRIMEGDVEFAPSEDGCRWCPAKSVCPALHGMVQDAARDDFRKHPDSELAALAGTDIEDMDWGERLLLVPFLRQWCKAVESETRNLLLQGEDVSGFKVVEGRKGNRSWMNRRRAIKLLMSYGANESQVYTDPTMISPAQAEALLKEFEENDRDVVKERKEELNECWVTGKVGPPTVVPESDSRKALDSGDMARRDFGFDEEEE